MGKFVDIYEKYKGCERMTGTFLVIVGINNLWREILRISRKPKDIQNTH